MSYLLLMCKTGGLAHLEAKVSPREGSCAGGRLCGAEGAGEAAGPLGQPEWAVPHRHTRTQTHLQRTQLGCQALLTTAYTHFNGEHLEPLKALYTNSGAYDRGGINMGRGLPER